jgi:hypothetical protein
MILYEIILKMGEEEETAKIISQDGRKFIKKGTWSVVIIGHGPIY